MSSNLTVDVKKNQTGSNRTTKEQIESEYKWLITILSDAAKAISDINGKNEQFDKLQGSLVKIVEERVLDAQIEMENSLNSIPWDNLVIAFFGETNAGKSTIIETFRILFDSKRNKNQDGKIVGDGRQDFTKEYYEYRLSIKGRPFTLIDVPGIEGDEKEFKDIIKGALRKAHCVFYVQGHNKKPDSATASKIKNYLGDWVNVYSIQNVRGAVTDYDEEEERETLLTPNVIKNEKLITDSFKEILSDVYKGNVPIQALLAMCSKATFAPERVDLQKTQDKLLKYFQSSDEVLRFSQFQTLINIVAEKANNFTLEIAEANRQKMISIANKVLESIRQEVDTNEQEFDKFEKQLRQYRRDVLTDCTDAINSIRYDVTALIERRYNSLKNTIYGIIDSNASNDDKKASIQSEASKVCGSLSREISAKCNSVINNLKIKNEQHKKQLNAFDFGKINIFLSGAYPQIDGEDMGFAVDELKIDIGDVGDFLGAVAGFAGVGAFFGPIGAGVGAGIGLGWHLLKKAFGDGGKGEAKEIVANSLKETCEITKRSAMEDVEKITNDIRSYSIKATRQIDSELQCLGELNRQTDGLRKQITNFDNKIKQVVYGIV
ncbi:MAG: 50S ribosome-binding GTPase, partial [Paludibacteraceae bacterium]|nr:50S ribosome-binding GTPase [Paludibacteraceae bacterium]